MTTQRQRPIYRVRDHQLYLSRLGTIVELFTQNSISHQKIWMAFKIVCFTILIQPLIWIQDLVFAKRIAAVSLQGEASPIFIIGHWRSGTTHLHYLMAKDPRLGTMSNYLTFTINVCLVGKGWLDRIFATLMPDKRPMDNVSISIDAPQEEEQCTGNVTSATGIHALFFPGNRSYFRKFMLFENVTAEEKRRWQVAYNRVLQTISFVNPGKRLLTKNPCNTSRVQELLELYPEAKFIFIHRNPVEIYRSTRNFYATIVESQFLQDAEESDIQDMIFQHYTMMLRKYLRERQRIPAGNLVEIRYDNLSSSPMETVKDIYDSLRLPGFEEAFPHFQSYLNTVRNYERNVFEPLTAEIEDRIHREWKFSFDEWHYETVKSSSTTAE